MFEEKHTGEEVDKENKDKWNQMMAIAHMAIKALWA